MQFFDRPILDTFLWTNPGITFKDFHVERVFETCEFLGAPVSISEIVDVYKLVETKLTSESKADQLVRLQLNPVNIRDFVIEAIDLTPMEAPVTLQLYRSELPVTKESQYKFTDRTFWQKTLSSKSSVASDILLIRNGLVCETSRFNIFLHDKAENRLITPSLKSGCLNGVLRRHLLKQGKVILPTGLEVKILESDIKADSIQRHDIYVGNSVRGILAAKII